METNRYAEWEKLCEELNTAQGEYMELHGILVRKAMGTGREDFRSGPTAGDFKRANEAKARVERLQSALDRFLEANVPAAKSS